MARTSFSGPVASDNGFEGSITGDITAAAVTTVDLTTTGDSSIDGASVLMPNLPTTDPAVAGQLWADSTAAFVLKVSQG